MKKGILIICDGFGEDNDSRYNPIIKANMYFVKLIKRFYPTTFIAAHGERVGLGKGQMGNSETGHLNIGAGRVVKQHVNIISEDIAKGELSKKSEFIQILQNTVKAKASLHLVGLLSDMGAHSHVEHLYGLIDIAAQYQLKNIYIHVITDGRDTATMAGIEYINGLRSHISKYKNVKIASVGGRYFAMDRDGYMTRTAEAYEVMFGDQKMNAKTSIEEYVLANYLKGVTDEFIMPYRLLDSNEYAFSSNDSIMFFNFRSDRMRQLVQMSREKLTNKLISMTPYSGSFSDVTTLFNNHVVNNGLTEYLSSQGLKVLKIAESTKYAHVTYFFNGGIEQPFANEDRVLIPGRRFKANNPNYKMRTKEIANAAIKAVRLGEHDLIIVNFACTDIIGHSANYVKSVKTLKLLDKVLCNIAQNAANNDYFFVLTSDHGNIEHIRTDDNEPYPAHTNNPVMFSILDPKRPDMTMRAGGALCDIAPTITTLMEIPAAKEFSGVSLVNIDN